ncbi:MAG TPA: fibronectin type III domain-containing protein, partial [Streptosporangiaceae bacterium]|nr:fibronectin type III domain-containing protein [Streptosporangiaceae bacterium]
MRPAPLHAHWPRSGCLRLGWLAALILVPAVILLAAGAVAPAASAQSNLLANGDFAAGSTAGWTCSPGDTVVTSPVYPGSSYALAGTPTGSDDAQCSQVVSVQPSSSYTLTGWVEGAYVYLGDSGTGGSDTSNWTPSATSWTELSTSFSTGSATTSVTVYIHGWYAQPTFYAGNLSLTGPAGSGGGGGGGTQAPAAPTGLTVTGTTSSSVSLSWTAPSGTVTGYHVYSGTSSAATVTGTSATITGLAASTAYTFTVTAYNPAGESPHSGAVSATTSGSGGGGGGGSSGLPAHLLMGYWQDFTNGATPLTLANVPASYNLIAVAFGNSDGTPGQVTFSLDSGLSSALGGYSQQQFISDIQTLHSRGQKVILSVGGQNGAISVSD